MKIRFTDRPTRRRDGQLGARAFVRMDGEYPKTFAFDTHGMTSTQVAEKIEKLREYHDARTERLRGFAGVRGAEITRGGDVFRVVDCTIFDAGVELYLDVRKVEQGGDLSKVRGFPIRMRYRELAKIPTNEAILQTIRDSLPDDADEKSAHNSFVSRVLQKVRR